MALVIETGSIVPGAESFASASELATYAENFGKIIPAAVPLQEALLRRAALQMGTMPWKGRTVDRDQALAWPRYDAYRNGFILPSDEIPPQIKAGQLALAAEIHGDDLAPPESKKGAVVRNRVEGAVDVQYASASSSASRPAAIRQSYAQFSGLLESSSQIRLRRS
ncbi:MAG: DnaT-like ssDNA-binding protein [Pseudomonas sp.]